jgi:phosphatidate cytidylyltransferase
LAERTAIALLSIVLVAIPCCCLLYLRIQAEPKWGLTLVISTIVIVKCSDTGAYFVGKSFGRHRMAPLVSPGKTWEGAAGGLVLAVLAAWLFHYLVVPRFHSRSPSLSLTQLTIYAATLHVAGVLGDLVESMLKRSAAKKDSANWLPGLGGILDVIDSLLWAAPVTYLYWAAGFFGEE